MRIKALNIYTNNLQGQINFYQNVLKIDLVALSDNTAEFKIGYSSLKFTYRENATPYHIAVNIPSNKDQEVLEWLKEKVSVLKDDGEELIQFKSWNANAMYFYDEDLNIIELISRRNLKQERKERFNKDQFLGISEIGIPVENVESTFKKIKAIGSISIYDGSFNRFCAAGDEDGLFIIIDKNKKKWFPTNDAAYSSDFILKGDINLQFLGGQIKGV